MTIPRARALAWLAALVVVAGVGSWALGNGERAGGADDVAAGGATPAGAERGRPGVSPRSR